MPEDRMDSNMELDIGVAIWQASNEEALRAHFDDGLTWTKFVYLLGIAFEGGAIWQNQAVLEEVDRIKRERDRG